MLELTTEYLFDAHIDAVPSDEYMPAGNGGWGDRCIIPITGGTIEGPRIKGVVKPFGADWVLIRPDGVLEVDVRLVIETDDGAFIHMYYDGIADIPEDQIADALAGKWPPVIRGHTTPRFETGHEDYLWLNKIKGVAIGEGKAKDGLFNVYYSVYALT